MDFGCLLEGTIGLLAIIGLVCTVLGVSYILAWFTD
jgi:hypothetical protein